jgi:glutamate-ammonia-ligase adenylyltransferase
MAARNPSLARLGVGANLLPRLQALGWVTDGWVNPAAEKLLLAARSGPDPEGTINRLAALAEKRPDVGFETLRELMPLAAASRALWEALLRHPEWTTGGEGPADDPRMLVQHRMIGIALADLAGRVGLEETSASLSQLADEAAELALANSRRRLAARWPDAERLPLAVIAMGKWGGRELNYASDIDLLFVYRPPAGEESEDLRRLALRLAGAVVEELGGATREGIAFRVDTGLRPEGTTGPLVRTVDSYQQYYQRWGEPWEFQALLKARAAAGDPEVGRDFIEMIQPFVWPESLPADHVRHLRDLKVRAEENAPPLDLKRAPGGIRDVEFSVQLLQMIHGRGDGLLRESGTLPALRALAGGGYVKPEDAEALAESYVFLRTVEHRLQLWQMAQTHLVPENREHVALVLGYRPQVRTASEAFDADLQRHRARVRALHENLYYRPLLEAFASAPAGGLERERAAARLQALGFLDIDGAAQAFDDLTAGLSRRSRLMTQLLPLMLQWLADTPNPDLGLSQLRALVAESSDNTLLINTLRDRPLAAQRLCRLLGSSRMVARFLDRIPEFLPRLADDRLLLELPSGAEIVNTALERVRLRSSLPDREGALRRLVRRRKLRVAAADLLDLVDLEQVTAALTDTADAAAGAAWWTAIQEFPPGIPLLVVAMGKWGGRELGYGSDLDVVYATDLPEKGAAASRLAAEFAAILGRPSPDGEAYQVDAGLRPEGRQGALARSLEAFRTYYSQRAEPWERLALIKARVVAGDLELAGRFRDLILQHAYPAVVHEEEVRAIRHIKARVERERVPAGEDPDFHLKLGPGGLADVEFLTQLGQFRLGHRHPQLQQTSTIGALQALAEIGFISEGEQLALEESYRLCSHIRNRLFLQTGRPLDSLPTDTAEGARLARSLGYPNRAALREHYRRVTRRARRIVTERFFTD